MQAGELFNDDGKQAKQHFVIMTRKEARSLNDVLEAATKLKIKGAKSLEKKFAEVLECY